MAISITCRCGKSFEAPDTLAGRKAKCPNCGGVLSIPDRPASESIFDELSDLAEAAELASSASASGRQLSGSGPLGAQSSGSLLSMHQAKKPLPIGAIVAGSGVALVLVVLLVLLLLGGGPTQERRSSAEQRPPQRGDDANTSTSSQSAQGTPTRDRPETVGNSRSTESESTNADSSRPSGGSLMQGLQSIVRGFGSGGRNRGQEDSQPPPGADSRYVAEKLPSGLLTWYGSGKLVSTRRASESDMLELHYGWMVGMLPHLGYQEHYDKFDFEKPWLDEANRELTALEVPEFLNPADDRKIYEGFRYGGMALTHFVGMSGVEDGRNVVAATLPRSDPRAGIFGYEDIATVREVKDGTSRTIMMVGTGELACPWVQSGGSTIRGAREPYFGELTGFGSGGGPGGKGTIAVLADGSVRWIKADIDPQVFRAMATIAGGEAETVSRVDPHEGPSSRLYSVPLTGHR